jgi:eukaryotic-like serine/threonine-protein kinase
VPVTSEPLFCRGCNQSFAVATADRRCPQCGEVLTAYELAPTLELDLTLLADQGLDAPEAMGPSEALVGKPFEGYTIDSFLGKGGMAWVFRATHNTLYRPCAIKILAPRPGSGEDMVDLFLTEARAAASLVHPHIVTVHNIGQSGALHYIELEYVPGQTLQQLVQAAGKLDAYSATDLLSQACSALAEAHRCGVVHRDFKPSNILVHRNGQAKLADFGLAKRVTRGGSSGDSLAGTPYFMAPELFRTRPASKASDVYAVGVSYYYLLTGEFPYVERNVARLAEKHANSPVPDPRERCPGLPDEAAELAIRCLSKLADERPADGESVYRELQTISRGVCSLNKLVDTALRDLIVTRQDEEQRVTVCVPQPHGRSQRVSVEECRAPIARERVVRIYSVCGRANPDYYRRALELNARLCHGALAIQDVNGEPHFVMSNSFPRTTCDPEEIRRSIQEIARWADQVEAALATADQY